jgi:amidase
MAAVPALLGSLESQITPASICFMSAVEMARLIRSKKLSAREALAEHLKQIERVNPKVNAIVTLVPELAAAAAAKADEMQAHRQTLGPLHGLPVAHKDLMETRGIRTTFGSPLYRDNIPTENDLVVERMSRAGAIIVGKTNTPEFGSGSQSSSTVFGATRNPYDLVTSFAAAWVAPLLHADSSRRIRPDTTDHCAIPRRFAMVGFRPSPEECQPKASFTLVDSGTSMPRRSVADLLLH